MESLEKRVQQLEDRAAIEELVYRYGELCDQNYDPDGLAALFTEDALWSVASADGRSDFGEHQGREAIRQFFAQVSADLVQPTLHYLLMPQIEIAADRQTARGKWYALGVLTASKDHETNLWGSTADHEYRKEDGRWRFARFVATGHFQSASVSRTLEPEFPGQD